MLDHVGSAIFGVLTDVFIMWSTAADGLKPLRKLSVPVVGVNPSRRVRCRMRRRPQGMSDVGTKGSSDVSAVSLGNGSIAFVVILVTSGAVEAPPSHDRPCFIADLLSIATPV